MATDSPFDSFMPAAVTPAAPAKRTLRDAAAAAKLAPHVLAGVKAMRGWDDLFDVTDGELAAAVQVVTSIQIR